jgi:hypothetical protein
MATTTRGIFGFGGKKKTDKSADELIPMETPEEEARRQLALTEDQVLAIRDKSNLPPLVRAQLTLKDIPDIKFLHQMKAPAVRKRYALYGRASGLKPGVMWPSRDELQDLKSYERVFCKPLQEMTDEVRAQREREAEKRRLREKEVTENLKKLPKIKAEFWAKHKQMYKERDEEKAKKERLVQEVREFVGYELDPSDPRFEEALVKRDEELKKVLRAQRKQERQKLTLERLQALANEAMEREREDKDILDKSSAKAADKQVSKEGADN